MAGFRVVDIQNTREVSYDVSIQFYRPFMPAGYPARVALGIGFQERAFLESGIESGKFLCYLTTILSTNPNGDEGAPMDGKRFSRRMFLGGIAAVAAGHSAFGSTTRNGTVRVGLIGCGAEGRRLLRDLSRCEASVSVVYDAADLRKRRAAVEVGAPAVDDWRSVIEKPGVDAVAIATPPHLHAAIAMAAMEAGKHVYCASPMAMGIEDARAFRDCARKTDRVVQIGAAPAGEGQWRTARALIRSGAIGDVKWCQGRFHSARRAGTDETGRVDWRAFHPGIPCDAARFVRWRHYWDYSAGTAAESHYDELTALLYAVGATLPRRVSAAGGVYAGDGRETPDNLVFSAEYAGGLTIVLASAACATTATIRGSAGSLELCGTHVRLLRESTEGYVAESYRAEAEKGLVEDWIEAVRTGSPCICGAEEGYRAMVAVAMAVEAYRRKKTVRYDPAQCGVSEDVPRLCA